MATSPNTSADTAPIEAANTQAVFPWWLPALLLAAFGALALVAHGQNTLSIDTKVSDWVQGWNGRSAEGLARLGNALGGSIFGLGCLLVAWIGFTLLRRRRELWFVAIAGIGKLMAMSMKGVFDSPRPGLDQVEKHGTFDGYGFPSGHVTNAALVLGALVFVIVSVMPDSRARVWLLLLWSIGVSITAFARIWSGAHWFTDTVGGALLGASIVLIAANLSARIAVPVTSS